MSIIQHDLFPFVHYEYGEAYYGSYRGMRYRIGRDPLKNVHFDSPEDKAKAVFKVSIWKEPWAYSKAPAEDMYETTFPYTEEEFMQIAAFLNGYYEANRDKWRANEHDQDKVDFVHIPGLDDALIMGSGTAKAAPAAPAEDEEADPESPASGEAEEANTPEEETTLTAGTESDADAEEAMESVALGEAPEEDEEDYDDEPEDPDPSEL